MFARYRFESLSLPSAKKKADKRLSAADIETPLDNSATGDVRRALVNRFSSQMCPHS